MSESGCHVIYAPYCGARGHADAHRWSGPNLLSWLPHRALREGDMHPACGLQAERHSGNATRARGGPERQSGTVASSNGNCAGVLGAITKSRAGT